LGPHLHEYLGCDRLASDFGLLGVLHGRDKPGQPKPASCLASPNLVLPFWPHRLPRSLLTGQGQSPARLPVPVIPPKESGEM